MIKILINFKTNLIMIKSLKISSVLFILMVLVIIIILLQTLKPKQQKMYSGKTKTGKKFRM
jgi:hypothetical protein